MGLRMGVVLHLAQNNSPAHLGQGMGIFASSLERLQTKNVETGPQVVAQEDLDERTGARSQCSLAVLLLGGPGPNRKGLSAYRDSAGGADQILVAA